MYIEQKTEKIFYFSDQRVEKTTKILMLCYDDLRIEIICIDVVIYDELSICIYVML